MNKIMYYNLGANCGDRMMYIRSTDIEQKQWEKLLLSFPDEALFFMKKGKKIIIEDRCCKAHGKIQRIFCPAISDFLRIISGLKPISKQIKQHTEMALLAYEKNKIIKAKYKFFVGKLNNFTVRGRTIKMKKEPSVW